MARPALVALALALAAPAGAEDAPLTLTATIGYAGQYRPQSFNPVFLNVRSRLKAALAGAVVVRAKTQGLPWVEHHFPLHLAPGGSWRRTFSLRLPDYRHLERVSAELRDHDGAIRAQTLLCSGASLSALVPAGQPMDTAHHRLVAVLQDREEKTVVSLSKETAFVNAAGLSYERFPDQATGLEPLDALIWPEPAPERFPRADQFEALAQWVQTGGHLILPLGEKPWPAQDARLRTLIADLPDGYAWENPAVGPSPPASPEATDFWGMLPDAVFRATPRYFPDWDDTPPPRMNVEGWDDNPLVKRWKGLRALPDGDVALEALGPLAPLAVTRPAGLGRITVTALSTFEPPFSGSPEWALFWRAIIESARRHERRWAISEAAAFPHLSVNRLVEHARAQQRSFGWMFGWLFAFLVLAGPVDALLRRRSHHARLGVITLPAWVLLVLLGAFATREAPMTDAFQVQRLDVLDYSPDQGPTRETRFLAAISPLSGPHLLRFSPAPDALGLRDDIPTLESEPDPSVRDHLWRGAVEIRHRGDDLEVRLPPLPATTLTFESISITGATPPMSLHRRSNAAPPDAGAELTVQARGESPVHGIIVLDRGAQSAFTREQTLAPRSAPWTARETGSTQTGVVLDKLLPLGDAWGASASDDDIAAFSEAGMVERLRPCSLAWTLPLATRPQEEAWGYGMPGETIPEVHAALRSVRTPLDGRDVTPLALGWTLDAGQSMMIDDRRFPTPTWRLHRVSATEEE